MKRPDFKCMIVPSSERQFPVDPLPSKALKTIDAALNERVSFQFAFRSEESSTYDVFRVKVEVECPDELSVRTRRVGYVPVWHQNIPFEHNSVDNDGWGKLPGLVPDPLFDEQETVIRPCEKNAFWFTVTPSAKAKPGKYTVAVKAVILDRKGTETIGKPVVRKVDVVLHDIRIKPRKDFNVTHWFYADCLIAWYKTDMFDEKFWKILEAYFKNLAEHGQDTVYVPVFTPSLDKDKIPSQLLDVRRSGKGGYRFGWSDVKRYIDLARKCGLTRFEWCHLATQGGAKNAVRVYEGQGKGEKLLWPDGTPAVSDEYRGFLKAFLPEFKKFLDGEKVLDKSFFHISDEPHGEEARANYKAIRSLILEYAPWFKSMDALSEIEFAKEKLVETPVPILMRALDFIKEGIPTWCYYCGGPRAKYLNHLLDTALPKIAMHGFIFYRWPFKGFLHWGYNYWNIFGTRNLTDPFKSTNGEDGGGNTPDAAHGDMFLVYPGENGPVDSIRWEIFAEAMQDYALLQTLGIERDAKMMRDIVSFEDFPKSVEWREKTRRKLLAGCGK